MAKFSKAVVYEKVPEGSRPTLIFVDTRVSVSHSVGLAERSLYAKKHPI